MLRVAKIDTSKFTRSIKSIKGQFFDRAVRKALDKVSDQLLEDMKPDVPRDTGDLLGSWKKEYPRPLTVRAGLDIVYAMYQHQGRRQDGSRIIRNRPAGGKTFFMKIAVDKNYEKYVKLYKREVESFLQSKLR